MPIDASIPLQAKNIQIDAPVNQLAMMGEAMKIGEMGRGIEEQNRLNEYLRSGADLSNPDARRELVKYGKTGLAYGKALNEQDLSAANVKKTNAEISLKDMEIAREGYKNLLFNPSPTNFAAHLEDAVLNKKMTPEQAQQEYKTISSMNDAQRLDYVKSRALKAENYFQQQEQARHNKTTEDISAGHLTIAKEAAKGVAQTLTDAAGNVTLLDKQGNIIKKLDAAGKPSATYEKTAALQKQHGKDLNLAITEIEKAIKPGGALEKSTASGAGKLMDAAGNFIGYATPGSIASATLKPIADLGLKMVPRFEGPQSDKDTQSYKEAAGQLANESLPVATRKAAAETVVRLMKSRKGQFVNEVMANEGIGASTGAPALPPGFTPDK